jgi:superfamily I DNA and RNA helicase
VTLERASNSYPEYFSNLISPNDAVVIQSFPDEKAQDVWIASEIKKNLTEDELEAEDILVVLPDAYTSKSRGQRLMQELRRQKILSHLVGVNTSADSVFVPDSVAIAHIHRAKGNEAPVVYAIDSQYASRNFNAVTRRNGLFTAITRSRAWVRITGYGDGMGLISEEVQKIVGHNFRLEFTIPTWDQLQNLRHIFRERDPGDEANVRKATEGLSTFLEAFERGEVELQDLPANIRTRLLRQLQAELAGDDDR